MQLLQKCRKLEVPVFLNNKADMKWKSYKIVGFPFFSCLTFRLKSKTSFLACFWLILKAGHCLTAVEYFYKLHNRNQAKQARLQSLYQCDEIIICLFVLLNTKGNTEIALKQREGSALRYR